MTMASAAQRNRKPVQPEPSSNKQQPPAQGPYKPSINLAEKWPEVFEKRMMSTEPQGRYDRGPAEKEQIIFKDPRPDLEAQDNLESLNWGRFLAEAWDMNAELAITLHGFRCQGSRLIKTDKGYVIRAEVGEQAWKSQEEYNQARERYLVPHKDQLIRLLKKLR